ncbi:MAG: tetratricopeptide repeat protein [Gammaproteobacteria bacterium]|nr:tetratricopeptide repeat protein [Gammaproteobacteria bacterium]
MQLIEASGGTQVWGKRYDADIENLFDLEEELSRSIAATVTGQIESELQRIALAKGAAGQQAYDLLLGGIYHSYRFNRHDNVIAIDKLDQCLAQDPDNVRAHVYLEVCHIMDYLGRWTLDYQASFDLGKSHIERALQLDPELWLVQTFYSEYLVFCGEPAEANRHLDKALKINPNDTDALAIRAICLAVQGDFTASLQIATQICSMDPYHPWAEWELAGGQYHTDQYETCLETIAGFRTDPGFTRIFMIASHVKLGHTDAARQAMQDFLRVCQEDMLSMPKNIDAWYHYVYSTYPYDDKQYSRDLLGCLVQAGLEDKLATSASFIEPGEYPSILLLPFGNLSGDPEQDYFSDGITESIIVTLSASSGLRVKSRHTTFAYRDSMLTLDQIGAKLDVQYIVDGSIRKHGDQVHITVQDSETASGGQIWGKRYDAPLEDLFALEEELVQTIAGTISGRIGHSIKVNARHKPASNPKSYDYLLRGLYHMGKFTADDLEIAQQHIEKCIALDPEYGFAQVVLGWSYWQEVYTGLSESYESNFVEAEKCGQRALRLNPDDVDALTLTGADYLLLHEPEKALVYCRRAIEIEPGNTENQALMAFACIFIGDFQQARLHSQIMCKLCPVMPNWYYRIRGQIEQYDGDLDKAISLFERGLAVEPESPLCRFYLIHALMQKGDHARAQVLADEIRALDSGISGSGMVRVVSIDPSIRNAFQTDLEIFDLV